jgi:hypothetical protein
LFENLLFAANANNEDPHAAIKFLQKYNICPVEQCNCGGTLKWFAEKSKPDGCMKCNQCKKRQSLRNGTV